MGDQKNELICVCPLGIQMEMPRRLILWMPEVQGSTVEREWTARGRAQSNGSISVYRIYGIVNEGK